MKPAQAGLALKALLAAGRRASVVTEGTSMRPCLQAGDTVMLEAAGPDELVPGDLIAFFQNGHLVVHRYGGWVRKEGARWLRQKGDNQEGYGLVPADALVGRACAIQRGTAVRDLTRGAARLGSRVRGLRLLSTCVAREGVVRLVRGRGRRTAGPEAEFLALGTRLDLAPALEARCAALLAGALDWDKVLAGAAGLLPLLHRHLSRPALAPFVPAEVQADLAEAYRRTSLQNLRKQGLLRRILLAAREAGVPVLLLKGAFLAPWVYGDLGLRPMNDLDLLCRKEDEAALTGLLEGLGAVKALAPEDPGLEVSPLRKAVLEKTGHPPAWWFPKLCRVEVHYHLLAEHLPDDGALRAALWDQAQVRDWDGLEVRGLGPAHLALHLAAHLWHHLQAGEANLYWFCDLREALRAAEPAALRRLAEDLGLAEDCARAFALVGAPWGEEAAPDASEALQHLARVLEDRGAAGKGALARNYVAAVRAVRHVHGLHRRALYLLQLAFPAPRNLGRRYGVTDRRVLPFLYLIEPFVRSFAILKDLGRHVHHRLRS